MLLGLAESLDRAVREGEIDFAGGGAHRVRRDPELAEQTLGDPMVPLVLDIGASATGRQSCLPAVPLDESHPLEEREVP